MYLSRVKLDTDLRATKRAIANPQMLHAIVAGCFERDTKVRPLWRIDALDGATYLLVVSSIVPEFMGLTTQLSSPETAEVAVRNYDPFLSHLAKGDELRFRINANPVQSVKRVSAPTRRGKVTGLSIDKQGIWLQNRAIKNGFELIHFKVVSRGERVFKRGDDTVTLSVACFEGVLKVLDKDLLVKALTQGIGRAKAYGCGLITVARS